MGDLANRNAEMTLQTIENQNVLFQDIETRLIAAENGIQTLTNLIEGLRNQIHRSLVQKYGTGPTKT